MGKSLGWAMLMPYSNPSTASSDSGLLHTCQDLAVNKTPRFKRALACVSSSYFEEARLLGADVVERNKGVVGVLAHHHGVALTEGAAAHVLPADSNVEACNDGVRCDWRRLGRATTSRPVRDAPRDPSAGLTAGPS